MNMIGLPVEYVDGGVIQVNSKCNFILNEVILELVGDGKGIAEILPNEKGSMIILI